MSSGSSRTPRPWLSSHLTPSWDITQSILPLPRFTLPPLRLPSSTGNFEVLVMPSSPVREIIDLTSDPISPVEIIRPSSSQTFRALHATVPQSQSQRSNRDVILLDDQQNEGREEGNVERSGSPDIQLIYARPRPWPQHAHALNQQFPIEAWRDIPYQAVRPDRYEASPPYVIPRGRYGQRELLHDDGTIFTNADPQIDLPRDLDFIRQGFPMGDGPPAQPYPPTYQAPPPPRPGYTRAPNEDIVAICANCDDELGVGEDDLKKQVWASRKCGHVSIRTCVVQHVRLIANRFIVANVQRTDRKGRRPYGKVSPNHFQSARLRAVKPRLPTQRVSSRSFYDPTL